MPGSIEFKGNAPCIISGKKRVEIRKKGKQREKREPGILVIHNSISCVTFMCGSGDTSEPEKSFSEAKG